jgi:hypothetical protein
LIDETACFVTNFASSTAFVSSLAHSMEALYRRAST